MSNLANWLNNVTANKVGSVEIYKDEDCWSFSFTLQEVRLTLSLNEDYTSAYLGFSEIWDWQKTAIKFNSPDEFEDFNIRSYVLDWKKKFANPKEEVNN